MVPLCDPKSTKSPTNEEARDDSMGREALKTASASHRPFLSKAPSTDEISPMMRPRIESCNAPNISSSKSEFTKSTIRSPHLTLCPASFTFALPSATVTSTPQNWYTPAGQALQLKDSWWTSTALVDSWHRRWKRPRPLPPDRLRGVASGARVSHTTLPLQQESTAVVLPRLRKQSNKALPSRQHSRRTTSSEFPVMYQSSQFQEQVTHFATH